MRSCLIKEAAMGFFSRKKQETAGVDYCLFCGMDLVNGVCSRCGREAKPMADFEDFEFKMVPASVADDLGEQKKKLFGNDLLTVQEMIRDGNMYVAEILLDSTCEDSRDALTADEDETDTEYEYYVQFSTTDGRPCRQCCEAASADFHRVERHLKSGRRQGWLLKGVKKKKTYYYACAAQNATLGKMLRDGLATNFMLYGEDYEERRMAPKGARDSYEFRRVISRSWDDAQEGETV